METKKLLLWFNEIELDDIPQVGSKNASLEGMRKKLNAEGISIPDGSAVMLHTYKDLLEEAGIKTQIQEMISDFDSHNMHHLEEKRSKIHSLINKIKFPENLKGVILKTYTTLRKKVIEVIDLTIVDSATAEGVADSSFCGRSTYDNIRGGDVLLNACRKYFYLFLEKRIPQFQSIENVMLITSIGNLRVENSLNPKICSIKKNDDESIKGPKESRRVELSITISHIGNLTATYNHTTE